MNQSRLFALPVSAFVLTAILSGCGPKSWKADTYPVKGSITINGEPAPMVLIRLNSIGAPVDKRESIPWGEVDSDGTFTIRTYVKGDGAPPGEYAITLTWPDDPTAPEPRDRLKGAFAEVKNSPLTVKVENKSNELAPIALNNVKVLP